MYSEMTLWLQKILWNGELVSSIPDAYVKYFMFIPVFIIMFLIVIMLTPFIGMIADRFGIVNNTKDHSTNKLNKYENQDRRINPNKVPLLGGLAVLIPVAILIPAFLGFNATTIPILIGMVILMISGVIDDAFDLPMTTQFFLQTLAATIIAFSVINLTQLQIPFDGYIDLSSSIWESSLFGLPLEFVFPGDLVMIFWILVCINAIKWFGGVDALAESNLFLTFFLIFILAVRFETIIPLIIALLLSGGLAGFIPYNFNPAKIFSGSTGKTTLGFLVAVLAMISGAKLSTTIMILALPLLDFVYVIFKRIRTFKPETKKDYLSLPIHVMRADTSHLHHQLLKLNFSFKQVLLIEFSITFAVGILAIATTEAYRYAVLLLGLLGVFVVILGLHTIVRIRERKDPPQKEKEESPESKFSY